MVRWWKQAQLNNGLSVWIIYYDALMDRLICSSLGVFSRLSAGEHSHPAPPGGGLSRCSRVPVHRQRPAAVHMVGRPAFNHLNTVPFTNAQCAHGVLHHSWGYHKETLVFVVQMLLECKLIRFRQAQRCPLFQPSAGLKELTHFCPPLWVSWICKSRPRTNIWHCHAEPRSNTSVL